MYEKLCSAKRVLGNSFDPRENKFIACFSGEAGLTVVQRSIMRFFLYGATGVFVGGFFFSESAYKNFTQSCNPALLSGVNYSRNNSGDVECVNQSFNLGVALSSFGGCLAFVSYAAFSLSSIPEKWREEMNFQQKLWQDRLASKEEHAYTDGAVEGMLISTKPIMPPEIGFFVSRLLTRKDGAALARTCKNADQTAFTSREGEKRKVAKRMGAY